MDAVDILNIKLMKCGGIYNALKIAGIAESLRRGVHAGLHGGEQGRACCRCAACCSKEEHHDESDLDAAILLAERPGRRRIHQAYTILRCDRCAGSGYKRYRRDDRNIRWSMLWKKRDEASFMRCFISFAFFVLSGNIDITGGVRMHEKIRKQTVFCVIAVLAIFISENSGIAALERGRERS